MISCAVWDNTTLSLLDRTLLDRILLDPDSFSSFGVNIVFSNFF